MNIILKNEKAKYLELYEALVDKINTGVLASGAKLPSKRDLAINLNISQNTVINAYNLLLDEGYIYSIEKKGYYVSSQPICINVHPKTILDEVNEENILYDFTTQNVETFPITTFKKTINEILYANDFFNKTHFLGDLNLRITIKNHLEENRGIDVHENQILITSGMEIFERILKLTNIDTLGIENPGYHKIVKIAKNNNLSINYFNLDQEGVVCPLNRCILYTTPFNQYPTGIKMSIKRKKELIKWATQTKSIIIEDDFDAEFRINQAPTTSIISLCPDKVIFFSTFSTTMYPGLRISYAILPADILNLYIKKYSSYSCSVPTLDQKILNEFIKSGKYASHINKKKREYLNIRQMIINYLNKYPNIFKVNIDRNYLSLLVEIKKKIDIKKLTENLKKKQLKIQALDDLNVDNENKSNILILGYTAISKDKIIEGLNIIKKEIESQNSIS